MGIGKFFKALFGGQTPDVTRKAQQYVAYQKQSAEGKLAASYRRVAVITMSHELRHNLAECLKPLVEGEGYTYVDHSSVSEATGSQVVILDCQPKTDARLHDKYDKILRIKKSMGKIHDVMCLIGRRQDYKKYPRGTYLNVLYFCLKEGDLHHREPDLPPEGTETIEGPTLYNFADMPAAVAAKIKELSRL